MDFLNFLLFFFFAEFLVFHNAADFLGRKFTGLAKLCFLFLGETQGFCNIRSGFGLILIRLRLGMLAVNLLEFS